MESMIRIIGENEKGTPTDAYEDKTDLVSRLFSKEGFLQSALGLEHRPQQEAMALEVCQAIQKDESLLFEAGTGVGKSLAYLLPSIIFAMENSRSKYF